MKFRKMYCLSLLSVFALSGCGGSSSPNAMSTPSAVSAESAPAAVSALPATAASGVSVNTSANSVGFPVPAPYESVSSTFSNGFEGWNQTAFVTWIKNEGNPAPSLNFYSLGYTFDPFFTTNADKWLKVLKSNRQLIFSVDVLTKQLSFLPGNRDVLPLILEFRDYKNPPVPYPYVSVQTQLGTVQEDDVPAWKTMRIFINDTQSKTLPKGWVGYGAEDKQYRPILPRGRTFANVIANADEIVVTTQKAGFYHGLLYADINIDNIKLDKAVTAQ